MTIINVPAVMSNAPILFVHSKGKQKTEIQKRILKTEKGGFCFQK